MCELYNSRGYMRVDISRSMESWFRRPWRVRGGMNLCASVVEMASRMLISGVHEWAASTMVPRYLYEYERESLDGGCCGKSGCGGMSIEGDSGIMYCRVSCFVSWPRKIGMHSVLVGFILMVKP